MLPVARRLQAGPPSAVPRHKKMISKVQTTMFLLAGVENIFGI
jgi:hypothetical protein